jgi:hypothetical protein
VSDHFDTEDSRTDLTDLYVFPSSDRPGCSVLILDFNPEAVHGEIAWDPAASYEIKIDTDGDIEADVAYHVLFETTSGVDGRVTVYRASGVEARSTGRVGEAIIVRAEVHADGSADVVEANGCRFLAGLRSDPHFKDIKGFRNNFQFTGDDPVARRNVFGIALEVPTEALGGATLRLWARAMVAVDGALKPVDLAGRPGINNMFNILPEDDRDDRDEFNETSPREQRSRFSARFVARLTGLGYPLPEAEALAATLLPDVLEYRPSEPAAFPNGRTLTDDTADWTLELLTRGRLTSDLVGPHIDLLPTFPYLGRPHPPDEALTHLV